ncbi:MAG: SET domain-containing protein-lysine N-methyltransferase [Bacteroidetes bacterium]|nr:SET domain-containing protein-lysine N-methyltransferase [Bacteroidota bacterium]
MPKSRLILYWGIWVLFSVPGGGAWAQSPALASAQYLLDPYAVALRIPSGESYTDTIVSRIIVSTWAKPGKAGYLPAFFRSGTFAVAKSGVHGVGLFTDTATAFAVGDTVLWAFEKRRSTGYFMYDYREKPIATFVNNSDNPNTVMVKVPGGLVMIATRPIGFMEELTCSYQGVLDLFPGDQTLARQIRYW